MRRRDLAWFAAAVLAPAMALAIDAGGRVVAEGGVPAPHVEVLLEVSDMRLRHQVGYERATTGPDGVFTFNLDKYANIPQMGLEFSTQSPRFRDAVKIVKAAPEDFPVTVEIEVQPGSVGKGSVVDDLGKPVEGARVSAPGSRSVTTDERGEFEIFGLPARGTAGLTVAKDGYISFTTAVESQEPTLIEGLRLVLTPAAELRGVVLTPEGQPAKEGLVIIETEKETLRRRVSSDGSFHFRTAPRDLTAATVNVVTKEYCFTPRSFAADESTSSTIRLQLHWPLALTGQVLTPDGQPCAGARIAVETGEEEAPRWFPVDTDGRWRAAPWQPGQELTVTAMPADPTARRAMGELEFLREDSPGVWSGEVNPWPRGYRSVFRAEIQGDMIRMTRRDAGLGGLPGDVTYEGELDPGTGTMKGTLTVSAMAAKGEWSARAYEPSGSLRGIWDLRESISEGEFLQAPVRVRVAGAPMSGDQEVPLRLVAPLELAGRVLDAENYPVTEGQVMVVSWNGSRLLRRTAPIEVGGRYRLGGLPDGVLEVVAMTKDGEPVTEVPLVVRPGALDFDIKPSPEPSDPMDPDVAPSPSATPK